MCSYIELNETITIDLLTTDNLLSGKLMHNSNIGSIVAGSFPNNFEHRIFIFSCVQDPLVFVTVKSQEVLSAHSLRLHELLIGFLWTKLLFYNNKLTLDTPIPKLKIIRQLGHMTFGFKIKRRQKMCSFQIQVQSMDANIPLTQ